MMPARATIFLAALCSVGLCASVAFAVESIPAPLVFVDGPQLAAKWIGVNSEGKFDFQIGEEIKTLAPGDFLSWGARADLAAASQLVVLADGGLIAAKAVRLVGGELLIQSQNFGEPADIRTPAVVRLPAERARGIVFRLPAGAAERDRLVDQLLAARGDDDRLILANGDHAQGTLIAPPAPGAPPAGAAGPAAAPPDELKLLESQRTLTLETKAGGRTEKTAVPIENLAAVIFNPALVVTKAAKGNRQWVGFRDGTTLLCESIHTSGDAPRVTLAGNVVLPLNPFNEPTDEIVYFRSQSERVIYLSDLTPAGYRHWPFLSQSWQWRADRNVRGGWLRAGEAVGTKGLGVHSRSRLLFDVPADAKRLEAELALDAAAGQGGSVQFRVLLLPREGEWKTAFESPLVRGGDKPVPLSLDVAGARQVALIVEFGERGDQLDYADWLGARFVR